MKADIRIHPDAEAVARGAAEILAAHAGEQIALAGGSTPRRAYELVAGLRPDWSDTTLWLGDERMVGPQDERSNQRLVTDTWLEQLAPAMRPRLEPVLTAGDLGAAAEDYSGRLRAALGGGGLGLALLGIGPDGHTASLFPGTPAVDITDPAILAAGVARPGLEPFVPRVTLTLPAFAGAGEVVFVVAGASKADVVAKVFGERPDGALPSTHVQPSGGRLVVLLDAAAAAGL